MRNKLSKEQLKTWKLFYRFQASIFLEIEQRLHQTKAVPLNWYTVLMSLWETPDRRMKLNDLAKSVSIRKSSLSRLVDRLEEEKLITRHSCNQDGRCSYIELSQKGIREMAKTWSEYETVVKENFFTGLNDSDVADMNRLLKKLNPTVNAD